MARPFFLAVLTVVAALHSPAAHADKKGSGAKGETSQSKPAATTAPAKVKNYDFGGLDVSGRLRTPQLLYFLNRMQAEFDQTTPSKRSFMPELKRSGDEL